MTYRAIGLMSGSSLDGLDIVFADFNETSGNWDFDILASSCIPYDKQWQDDLRNATNLSARDYLALHAAYGKWIGQAVNSFIDKNNLHHQVQLIGSHGHTFFHEPQNGFTSQIGCGATIAAITGINTVSHLRALDIALGGQGAPIVPVGEKLLFADAKAFLNIGGIANISIHTVDGIIAYDICPANRVLNVLAEKLGKPFDEGGVLAEKGFVRDEVLSKMNALPYYTHAYPKSLANSFGLDVVLPLLEQANLSVPDALRTMVEHIAIQVSRNILRLGNKQGRNTSNGPHKLLVTGGGAFNSYLLTRLKNMMEIGGWQIDIPPAEVVNYKEALIMGLLAVLRWREEATTFPTTTGGKAASSGGAVWLGQQP